jgi:hypothetical protein
MVDCFVASRPRHHTRLFVDTSKVRCLHEILTEVVLLTSELKSKGIGLSDDLSG